MKVLDIDGLNYYDGKIKQTYASLASPALTGTPTAPTPTAGDNSTKLATTAFVKNAVDTKTADYLPLTGGTMTGDIALTPNTVVNGVSDDTGIMIVSKSGTKGTLPSKNTFYTLALARDASNINSNHGECRYGMLETGTGSDGRVWTEIVAYKNEANSDARGSIGVGVNSDGTKYTSAPTPTTSDNSTNIATTAYVKSNLGSYLPLSGGTMTGEIKRSGVLASSTVDTGLIQINGGTNGSNGAYIILYGKSHSSYAGRITLRTGDGTNSPAIILYPNGTATWNGNDILTDATVGSSLSKDLSSSVSLSASTAKTIISMSLPAGKWIVKGFVRYTGVTANKIYGVQITSSGNAFSYASSAGKTVHSSNTGNLSVQTTHVWNQSSTANIYLCGYGTAACTAENAVIQAIRIV